MELVICVRDLAGKCLIDCASRQAVVDALMKEQLVEVLQEDVKVWVKEWKPRISEEAGRLSLLGTTDRLRRQTCGQQLLIREGRNLAILVDKWGIWLRIATERKE